MGVSEFIIPAIELSILVCAVANKKAGIKIPIMPERNGFQYWFVGSAFKFTNAKGNNTMDAAVTRSAPTSSGENTSNPFFIRIKDVPQMIDKMISRKIAVKRELSDIEKGKLQRFERLKITNGSAFSNPILAILKYYAIRDCVVAAIPYFRTFIITQNLNT